MSWINKIKDASVAKIVRFWANRNRKEFGVMMDLKLNSKQRFVQAEVLPIGETIAINVSAQYHLLPDPGGGTLLELSDIQTSREWINIFLQAVSPRGVTIAVSPTYGQLLRLAL